MKKTDKFIPVITVVVCYSDKPWDGATTLHGMLDIPDKMKPFVNDYKMHLIEARKNDLIFHNMNNTAFFDMLKVVLDKDISKEEARKKAIDYATTHNVDKTVVMTVAGATNCNIDYDALSKKGDVNMCTLFDEIAKEGEMKGIQQGIQQGVQQGIQQGVQQGIQVLIESLQEMEIPFSKSKKLLMAKFSLSEDNAQNYMDEYWK